MVTFFDHFRVLNPKCYTLLPGCNAFPLFYRIYCSYMVQAGLEGGRFQEIPPKSLHRVEFRAGFQKFGTITHLRLFWKVIILGIT